VRAFLLALALTLASSTVYACNPRTDFDSAGCIAGLGMAFLTAPVAILDYGVSKAAAYERAIPSNKQAEFIVGAPVAFATVLYLYAKATNTSMTYTSVNVLPFISENESVGVTFIKRF
jgi:hypothetical protein